MPTEYIMGNPLNESTQGCLGHVMYFNFVTFGVTHVCLVTTMFSQPLKISEYNSRIQARG
jgi:hypothetical protein